MTRACVWIALALATAACAGDPAPAARAPEPTDETIRHLQELLAADPASALLLYDLGTAQLLQRRYDAARPPLERAARTETPPALRQRSHYNLGNVDLEPAFADSSRAGREEELRRAIQQYRAALLLDPGDMDAKWNLELAQRMLPRPQDPSGGGGGGGGGGGSDPEQGRHDPRPSGGSGGGSDPDVTRERAEQLLEEARRRELGVQRDKLRRPQPRNPSAH